MVETDREPQTPIQKGVSPQFEYFINSLHLDARKSQENMMRFQYINAITRVVLEHEESGEKFNHQLALSSFIKHQETRFISGHIKLVNDLDKISRRLALQWDNDHLDEPESFVIEAIVRNGIHASLFHHFGFVGMQYREFLEEKGVPEEKRQPTFIF